ncbi:MAG: hypothetical protein IKT68_01695 [Clostridia bacterium]|nr:hypothetical protein [Clostridia bacterium]
MKKYITFILLAGLLLSCFAGCNQDEVDSTNVTPTEVTSNDLTENQPEVQENKETQQDQSAVSQDSDAINDEKPDQNEAKQEPASNSVKVNPTEIHGADIAREYPTFVSEQALQTWLQKGSGAYETDRSDYLMQASKSNIVNYYHPSEDLIKLVSLNEIELHTPSNTYIYQYIFDDGKELTLSLNTAKIPGFYESDESFLENKKQGYLMGQKGYQYYKEPKTGIEFYWNYADYDTTQIAWMQYGLVQFASFTGHKDILDELLPYLVLEQVTVNLNSDHVTQ